jgi:hypothetical protein
VVYGTDTDGPGEIECGGGTSLRSVLVLTWSATPASEMLMSVIELFDGK